MAMDKNLNLATQKLIDAYEFGENSPQYRDAFNQYLIEFKRVALTIGEPVLFDHDPYDTIIEMVAMDEKPEFIEKAIEEFGQMVQILVDIGYNRVDRWKSEYTECYNLFHGMEA